MESIIERNCRKDGFDIFMPSFYTELRHHRTKQILQKRFPFLVGYGFVSLPRLNFEELRRVDGVVCFLRGANYGPLEFPDGYHRGPVLRRSRATAGLPLQAALPEGDRAPRANPALGRPAPEDPAKGSESARLHGRSCRECYRFSKPADQRASADNYQWIEQPHC
ncbi:hypothetical protein CN190_10090 [Sinorhizobium meliloti]|nr:hypothetical protein CN190_10090 [Sinorhizobium meliloti]